MATVSNGTAPSGGVSDWAVTAKSKPGFIKNKPPLTSTVTSLTLGVDTIVIGSLSATSLAGPCISNVYTSDSDTIAASTSALKSVADLIGSGDFLPLTGGTVNGNVGIGSVPNTNDYNLTVQGTAGVSGNITAFTSDNRLKERTGTLTGALDRICALEGFTYRHNDLARSHGFTDDRQYVGLSAQDLQRVLPEAVFPAPFNADYLTVQYERIVPLLVEALKEERAKREALEKYLGLT